MRDDLRTYQPLLQQEFAAVFRQFPFDITELTAILQSKENENLHPFSRKSRVVELAAEHCPVYIMPHYPFACMLNAGQTRVHWHDGIGNYCRMQSRVDLTPVQTFIARNWENHLLYCNDFTDFMHRAPGYEELLEKGFSGIAADCIHRKAQTKDPEKLRFYDGLICCCHSMKRLGERFSEEALALLEKLPETADSFSRRNLHRIANTCRRVPWQPPETFFEAIQTLMFCYEVFSALDGIEVNTYGMIDRLLEPYYRKDLEAGRISKEEAYSLLSMFLYITDGQYSGRESEEQETACTVMLGGQDAEGQPVYNEITQMVLQAYQQYRYVSPKLNVRVMQNSPQEYLIGISRLILSGCNVVVVQNDEYHVGMLMKMGLTQQDARLYIGGGCQEIIVPGMQVHSRAFAYPNMPAVLLDTLYGTREELYGKALKRDFSSFESLYHSFLENLRALIAQMVAVFTPYARNPLVSGDRSVTDICFASGFGSFSSFSRAFQKQYGMTPIQVRKTGSDL